MDQEGSISEVEQNSCPQPSSSSSSPSLEDVMKLLRGQTDSQRLAGLFLVAKFSQDGRHQENMVKIYRALDPTFLRRLLLTGMGKGTSSAGCDNANRDTYLRLSVTMLSAFARVPDIAATEEMLEKVPFFLEIMSKESDPAVYEECYEFLLLVSTAHEDGVVTLFESGGMKVLASHLPALQDGSCAIELGMKLVQLMINKLPGEKVFTEHRSDLSKMVTVIAKQFAVLHNAIKFEALHLLSNILSSNYSAALFPVLQSMLGDNWSTNLRIGILAVLQNRVAPEEKLQALVLAESAMSIAGEEWLLGPLSFPDECSSFPADRCILLVLESSRVEIAVILNDIAYLKYEAGQTSSSNADSFLVKLRNLGVAFALVERIIKLISKFGENEESDSNSIISEGTMTKIIGGLNETVDVVLDYLQDAKENGQRKGDDLLASVRIVGRYLAEAPHGCEEKVKKLLAYMLSVEGADETSPFYSNCFLLPMLCQITMTSDGCKVFASTGVFRVVVEHLTSLINSKSRKTEDTGSIFLACDTIMNFLLKIQELQFSLDDPCFVKLLQALTFWAEKLSDPTAIMMASSICTLILDSTSEEALLRHPYFNMESLISLSQLMRRSLVTLSEDLMSEDSSSEADLREIVASGYSSWADRFPRIKEVVER